MMGAVEVDWLRERLYRGEICVDDGYGVTPESGTWVSGIVYTVVMNMCWKRLCVELYTVNCVC